MLVMASASAITGVQVHSALLLTVSAGSTVDVVAACAVYWRLSHEAKNDDLAMIEANERRASRLVGVLLLVAALFAVGTASYKLWTRTGAEDSAIGLAVALVTALWMPFLGRAKMRLAEQLQSSALRASGAGTVLCGLMALVLLIGLGTTTLFHWWWADSVGALLLVPMLLKEAKEAWGVGDHG